MGYAADMCDIVTANAGEKVRFFVRVDPDDRTQDVLFLREDVEWTDRRAELIDTELQELVAKGAYEKQMDAENVTQLVKVADDSILFTGFIEDEVVVVHFERGVLGVLPTVVGEFREYMLEHDIEFTALSMTPDRD